MVASSFNCVPGIPILHSKDLVNWSVANYGLKSQIPAEVYDTPQHGKGVWAPSIRYHNGVYFIYYPDPDYGIYMIQSASPLDSWSKPKLILKGKGIIDPAPFWDDDGKCYLVTAWAGSRAGVKSLITVFRLNSDGSEVTDEGKHVFDGHDENPTIEGPKLYKRNGYYYIFAPAGGVQDGWQLVMRSTDIYGPYQAKVVMDQGKTKINGPHQGAWVETQSGESWFLHFQDKGPYGRVVHLQPMTWKHDWPVIGSEQNGGEKGEPVASFRKPNVGKEYSTTTPAEGDEFNSDHLGLQWQWQANSQIQWYALIRGSGFLRLFALPFKETANNLWKVPNLLLQKFPAPTFSVAVKVSFHAGVDAQQQKAGLIVMGNDYAYLAISREQDHYKVSQIVCLDAKAGNKETVVETRNITTNQVYLKLRVSENAVCNFSYSEDGQSYQNLGKQFTAKPDQWVGAKTGLFSVGEQNSKLGGYADFDWFRVTK